MSYATIIGGLYLPPPGSFNSNLPSLGEQNLSAATHKAAFIFRCPKAGTLDQLEFMMGSANVGLTGKISFQDVDTTTGDPDGTIDQFRTFSIVQNTWTIPGLITSDGTNSGTKRTVALNEWLAAVVEFDTFPGGVLFSPKFLGATPNGVPFLGSIYGLDFFNGAVWSKTAAGGYPSMALKYSDGTYGYVNPYAYPYTAITTRNLNTTSSPDEFAMRFQLNFDAYLNGAHVLVDNDGDCDITLLDASDTILGGPVSFDKDIRQQNAVIGVVANFTDVLLTKNTTYRLSVKPTSGTNITIFTYDVPSNTYFQTCEGGIQIYNSSRTDAGAWTDVDNRRLFASIRISQIPDTSSAGGAGGSFTFGG